jgi:hypothetical protein
VSLKNTHSKLFAGGLLSIFSSGVAGQCSLDGPCAALAVIGIILCIAALINFVEKNS